MLRTITAAAARPTLAAAVRAPAALAPRARLYHDKVRPL
jgi:hypothetical protein